MSKETPREPRCENCVHWKNPWTSFAADAPRWGTCQLIGLTLPAFTKDASDYIADELRRDDP